MRQLLTALVGLIALSGCGVEEYDLRENIHTGAEAQRLIIQIEARPGAPSLPESARDYYIYDGGSFNGSIVYWSFNCASREDCWKALACLDAPTPSEFQPWRPSRYGVVTYGPGFYDEKLQDDRWDVSHIKNGAVYESVNGGNRSMRYYAIDFDRNRVYGHYESGGFPTDAHPQRD